MGATDKNTAMAETGDWPAELHFQKIRPRRTRRRSHSPSRDVSPVPSYYSEPVSVRQRKDVTVRLPPLIRGAHQDEEDDEEDTQSLKSLPTVMSTLAFDPKVKRSHRLPRGQAISGPNLSTLLTSNCTLMVNGTGCTRARGFLPAIKSKSLERPPCRAGRRSEKLERRGPPHSYTTDHLQNAPISESSCSEKTLNHRRRNQILPSSSAVDEVPPGPRITFHSPVVQAVYPITPIKRTRQQRRPVLKKAQLANRRAFHFLLEESYYPIPGEPHLLDPLFGFQEHLCRQIVNSPLPCQAPLPQIHPHYFLHQRPCKPPKDRTVELCNLLGKQLPRITMTCPTPPKVLPCTEKRHAA